MWRADVCSREDAPADGESTAEELLQDGAFGVGSGRVISLNLSQSPCTEGVAVLEYDALDVVALIGEAEHLVDEVRPIALDAQALGEAGADIETGGPCGDHDGRRGEHGALEGGDITEDGCGVQTPPGHVVGEDPLTEGIDVTVGYGPCAFPECEGEAADAAEEIEQRDAIGHGCILLINLSQALARGMCRIPMNREHGLRD